MRNTEQGSGGVADPDLLALNETLVRLRSYLRGARYRARFHEDGVEVPLTVRNVVRAVELESLEGEVCVGDVASRLAVEPSSASRQVDYAVRLGLLSKKSSRVDARRLALELTERGAEMARRWAQLRAEHLAEALAGWSEDEVALLITYTTRLADDIEALER